MTYRVLVLSQALIEATFDVADCINVVADGYRLLAQGRGELSPKYHWEFSAGRSAAFASSAEDTLGIKVANIRPGNRTAGLPTGISQILLHRAMSGEPLALIDGTSITAMRTAAAAALGAKVLARPDSRRVALFGPGVVGRRSLAAVASVFRVERAFVVGVDEAESTGFVDEHANDYPFELTAAAPEDAVRSADIVLTLTPSTTPIVMNDWVRDGTHISAIGADWKGKQELETALLLRSTVVTDNRQQCLEIGEGNVPHASGRFSAADIHAELGEVLTNEAAGRQSENQVTVFDSSGIAIQDLVAARWVFSEASKRGIGEWVEL